jgi:uncharacterized membrane protein (UPF0127 family)
MEIIARKRSADPVQEQLREAKDRWNLAAKELISRLIAFKRGMNGRGDARYGLPISKIHEPLPAEIGTFLSELSSNFQQLAEEANRIVQQQAYYAEHRRKPAKGPLTETPKAASKIATASIKQESFLLIGKEKIPTLLAITAQEQEQGLMGVAWPPPVMSFVYDQPRLQKYWMKNTISPLDIVFCLAGRITSIQKGEPYSTKLIGDHVPSDLVIEFPYGTCKAKNITIGDRIKLITA